MAAQRHKWDPVCPPPRNLVRPVPIDPTGQAGPTRGQAYGPRWRSTTSGLFVPAAVDADIPEQRILEQSMRLPADGAVTGWASCRLHGANFLDGLLTDGRTQLPVALCVGALDQIRKRPGSVLSRERLFANEVLRLYGIACTTRLRALFDAMRMAPNVREAVVAMDMMAAAELVSISQMRKYVEQHPGWHGVEQVRAALDLADEGSLSPNETRTRLIWEVDAKFPRPLTNQHVWDLRGNLLGIADILDPIAGVVGEYDGADHRGAYRHSKDLDREGRFRKHLLEFFRVTGPDIPVTTRVVDRMALTRSRAHYVPPERRTWTLVPPPGWEPQFSLDDRMELKEIRCAPIDDLLPPPPGP